MRHRKRRGAEEINLTPLLDVLFSILFIVMLSAMSDKTSYTEDTAQQSQTIEQQVGTIDAQDALIAEQSADISELQAENADLTQALQNSENEKSSMKLYTENAVILTVSNRTDDGNHILDIFVGDSEDAAESIRMGSDRIQNMTERMTDFVREQIDSVDSQPVYIVFYCDKSQIYTSEYNAVTAAFEELEYTEKEVFYKEAEEQTDE